MYIIYNRFRNQYKTGEGWTVIDNGVLKGLHGVLRFTQREMELNKDNLPAGSVFVHFPRRRWSDLDE